MISRNTATLKSGNTYTPYLNCNGQLSFLNICEQSFMKINIFEQKKINYSQEIYERLNTSKCINPQLIEYITPIFNLEGPSDIEIRKYDMNNSYGSQLEYLRLPYKDLGTTYLFDSYPTRIDYIFSSKELEIINFENIGNTFSDHYPISAEVLWDK